MQNIRFKNYRCFDDTGVVNLKPLTFLVGANSSGKSSFLKFFPLMRQSFGRPRNGMFLWSYKDVDFQNLENILRDKTKDFIFEFTIDKPLCVFGGKVRNFSLNSSVHVNVHLGLKANGFDYLHYFSLEYCEQKIEVYLNEKSECVKIWINESFNALECEEAVHVSSTNALLPNIRFGKQNTLFTEQSPFAQDELFKIFNSCENVVQRPFRLINRIDTKEYYASQFTTSCKKIFSETEIDTINNLLVLYHLNDIIDIVNIHLIGIVSNMSYIGPIRAKAKREYSIQNWAIDEIESDGNNIAMVLFNLEEQQREDFENWLKVNFNIQLRVPVVGHSVEILLAIGEHDFVNIIDLGFGYSQILPILMTVWYSTHFTKSPQMIDLRSKTLRHYVVIEQPELHLHPRMQSDLADLFVKVIKATRDLGQDVHFIIETHSQALLNQIGNNIYHEQITRDDVNVVLFNATAEDMDNYVEQAQFSEDGFLENWPIGFFSGNAD